MNKTIIIIPTYNESQNIKKIITKIDSLKIKNDFLIIDDNSPDKTYDVVKEMMKKRTDINLIIQSKKNGLGTAYIRGFEWAIKKKYDRIIQIDADLSHNPQDIPTMIELMADYDMVIGSRYIKGINVVNWPMSRLILSYMANVYVKLITRMKINDSTSGYKCISAEVLKKINLKKINSQGYSFQIEVNFLASVNNFKIKEIPIIFHDRTVGESKMSKSIIFEAIFMVPKLALKKILRIW